MDIVSNIAEIQQQARIYSKELNGSAWMQDQLPRNHTWYLVPLPDGAPVVVNEAFLGHRVGSAEQYRQITSAEIAAAGRRVKRWFRRAEEGHELRLVKDLVVQLVRQYGRRIREPVTFWVPQEMSLWGPVSAFSEVPPRPLHLGNVHMLRGTIPAAIYRGDKYYVAECPLLGIVTQGLTLDETLSNLREAFELAIEDEDPARFGVAPGALLLVQIEAAQWAA